MLSSSTFAPHLSYFIALLLCTLMCFATPAMSREQAVILQYHHVSDDTPTSTSISPAQFRKHLDWLADNDFQVLPLPEIVATLRTGDRFAQDRVVALTFDDANRSVCDVAWPVLKQRGLPFTVFINSEAIEQGHQFQCTWEQLAAMQQSGLMTPANHTHTHLHMLSTPDVNTDAWRDRMRAEIQQAQDLISHKVGNASMLFAYPYGEYNRALAQLVTNMGYTGFGQHSGAVGRLSDFSALPRYPASGQFAKLESLRTKLLSLPFPGRFVPQNDNPIAVDGPHNPPALVIEAESESALAGVNCFNAQGQPLPVKRDANTLTVRADEALSAGRHRYTCTRASNQQGRFHWLSHQWLVE